ncbi:transporter substrate-binding domain-containing protein [Desulfobacterales bacterium HSG16]|nr:transporter substrate-binding domain-containing protein [Desulfobacterales bacterium HSG16]
MKRVFIAVMTIMMCLGSVHSSHAGETIRLTNGEWPPYMSETLQYGGTASRIVTEAFALEGVTVQYGWFPWKRGFIYAQKGKWDGSIGWKKTEDRKKFFHFSKPLFEGKTVFFHLKSFDFDWNTIDDLKIFRIGGTLGYGGYGEAFAQAEKDKLINVERIPRDEQNFRKLLFKRIMLFPLDLNVGYAILNQHFAPDEIEKITYHSKPLVSNLYHLILSKKVERNGRMMELFSEGLKQLKASGKYDQFLEESKSGDYSKN